MTGKIQNQLQKASAAKPAEKQTVNTMLNSILDGEGMRKRFDELLGKRSPQFISSIVSLVNANKDMQAAMYEAPMTVIQSALKAATYDLPIDPGLGYAHIVPFRNYKKDLDKKVMEASFILGWKGMHQLAMRTGAYKIINVVDIRAGELKAYNRLTEEIEIEFIEDEEKRDAAPVIGYVGYYRLVNGAEKTIYMTVKQIERHEKKFRKGQYQTKGWRDDWDAMARKTVYRILIGKWGIMSIDYKTADEGRQIANIISEDAHAEDAIAADYVIVEDTGEVIENE